MQHHAKHLAEQLKTCLDDLGMADNIRDRSVFLSKTLHIPKQQAWAILEGHVVPDADLLKTMSQELEMDLSEFYKK